MVITVPYFVLLWFCFNHSVVKVDERKKKKKKKTLFNYPKFYLLLQSTPPPQNESSLTFRLVLSRGTSTFPGSAYAYKIFGPLVFSSVILNSRNRLTRKLTTSRHECFFFLLIFLPPLSLCLKKLAFIFFITYPYQVTHKFYFSECQCSAAK